MYVSSWKNNGTCVVERQLPDKDIFGIQTGQVDRDGNLLWEVEHWFKEKRRWFDGYFPSATSGELAARGVFDIHLGAGGLIFVKAPCARADTEAMFFLHLIPAMWLTSPAIAGSTASTTWTSFSTSTARDSTANAGRKSLSRNTISPKSGPASSFPARGQVWKEEFRTQGSSESADATGR